MLLVEETLKMIIAVIAIGFLIYFLVSLYFAKVQGNELNQANADIGYLKEVINGKVKNATLNNPVGWHIFSFTEGNKPNACAGENCLCICDKVFWSRIQLWKSADELQFSECNEGGACVAVKNLKSFESIEIKKLTLVNLNYEDGVGLK